MNEIDVWTVIERYKDGAKASDSPYGVADGSKGAELFPEDALAMAVLCEATFIRAGGTQKIERMIARAFPVEAECDEWDYWANALAHLDEARALVARDEVTEDPGLFPVLQ